MWVALHWLFVFISNPRPVYHVLASSILFIFLRLCLKRKLQYKKNFQSTFGIVLMYFGFALTKHIAHYGFLPFYCLSFIGLRNKTYSFLLFSVVIGVFIHFIPLPIVIGSIMMNIGRLIRIKKLNIHMCIISHFVVGMVLLLVDGEITITYKELLSAVSIIHMIGKDTRMDIFSILMCYSYLWALLLPLLHATCMDWYQCYENNHFYRVRRQYKYITPVCILLLRVFYAYVLQ